MTPAIAIGRVEPQHLLFVTHPVASASDSTAQAVIAELDALRRAAAVYRPHPRYTAPGEFVDALRRLVDAQH